ncbi:helicase HerA-like domain-containing protein [Candidatus Thiothrix sp. Deng01]|uniref:Helicase HerA-like domain-containing protein n=1 Tax=Candidatus Thiothrix phosphatis TaxID=3112415 RepID=A0ABU6D2Q9_9GAMM|nr:helicase HerA-like domain-containing protein [Candidatus Thiothrix sp. Deng01]MEB4592943.1 helicase HerA-like domain-containing protein [Candidatus Thiothrix sp. Deng01]
MSEQTGILIGKGEEKVFLNPRFANRHGLIAGATGTGKTISLQILAEGFARIGVPVFMADIKGDLTGIAAAGTANPKVDERVQKIGIDGFKFASCPTIIWDLSGERGHPVRATISDMGPVLLARLLDLNDTQEGVLNIAFKFADDQGMLLLDLKDLRSILQYLGENSREFSNTYGNVSSASVGAIQRQLLVLEQQGADKFFGEPALDLWDFIRTGAGGYGNVNILAADRLINTPRLYSTFLLWLLAELFEDLPEVGDLDKPRLVFFFDEAHLLFDDAPKALVDKVEQVVKLIRSKGVGIYFITQNPLDIPDSVLGQLGNRIQHALRAFTPRDQKAVRTAADTFRQNPNLNTAETIMQMEVGEALVSVLEDKGIPSMVQRVLIRPPESRIGPLTEAERADLLRASPFAGRYDAMVDRESAYELLQKRAAAAAEEAAAIKAQAEADKEARRTARSRPREPDSLLDSIGETMLKNAVKAATSSAGRRIGTQLVRGILGSLFKGR